MTHFAIFLCVVGLLSTTLQLVLGTGIRAATVHFVSMEDAENNKAVSDPLSKFWIQRRAGVKLLQGKITKLEAGTSFLIAKSSLANLLGKHSTDLRNGLTSWLTSNVYATALSTQGISRKEAEYSVTYEGLANAALIILEVEVEKDGGGSEVQYYHVEVVPQLEGYVNPLKEDKDLRQNVEFKVGDRFNASPPETLKIEINEADRAKLDKIEEENRVRIEKGFNRPSLDGVKVELRNDIDEVICHGLTLFAYIVNVDSLEMGTMAKAASVFSDKVKAKTSIRLAVGGPRKLVGSDGQLKYWLKYLYATEDGTKGAVFIDHLKV